MSVSPSVIRRPVTRADACDVPWESARLLAAASSQRLRAVTRPAGDCLGQVLVGPLSARTDMPPFDRSAMDGWVVSGPAPWWLVGEARAGDRPPPLNPGEAADIATGAMLPAGATAVLRRERGRVHDGRVVPDPGSAPSRGSDVRRRADECRAGEVLLGPGCEVTPLVLGLAASAGADELLVTRAPRVAIFVLGDELVARGVPPDGRVRDALGPILPGWLRLLGADVVSCLPVGDSLDELGGALEAVTQHTDLVLTTGGTAAGRADHLHAALARLGAELVVDGVAVRPGHPMLLATVPRRHCLVVGLPGNPLAAVSGLLTLAAPVLRTMRGLGPADEPWRHLGTSLARHPSDTRLVPVRESTALAHGGPDMLRGAALADGVAVIPPGDGPSQRCTRVLPLPWSAAGYTPHDCDRGSTFEEAGGASA